MNSLRNIERNIKENIIWSPQSSFLKYHVVTRAGYLTLTPLYLLTSIADTGLGLCGSAAAIATLGMHTPINKFSLRHLQSSTFILSKPYECFRKFLYPNSDDHWVNMPSKLNPRLYNTLSLGSNSENFLLNEIILRINIIIESFLLVLTGSMDAVIGVIATPLSLTTFGALSSVNGFAQCGLYSTRLIGLIAINIIRFINPHARFDDEPGTPLPHKVSKIPPPKSSNCCYSRGEC